MIDWQIAFDKLRRNPRTPVIGTFFFGACLLWSLCALILTFLEKNPTPPPTVTRAIAPPLISLDQLHLFGVYNAAQAKLPLANLQLTLQGTVVVTQAPNESRALIASPGKPAEVYHVGDTLPGNATITHISEKDIVINQNGSLAKLELPIQTVTNSE